MIKISSTVTFRSLFLFFTLILFISGLNAQVGTPSYYNNTGVTSNTIPLNFTSNKCQFIYGPNVFTTTGLGGPITVGAGNNITKVYIKFSNTVNATNSIANFTISLGQNVGTVNTIPSTTFNTGLTQCFFASSFQFTGITAGAWYGVTLQTPFTYDPNLSLVVELKTTSTTSGNSIGYITTTGLNQRLYAANAAVTGTSGTGLLHFGMDVVSASPCTSPPVPGTLSASATTVCPNANFTINITGGTVGGGQTY